MTTNPFTIAARAEAERRYMPYREYPATVMEDREIKAHIGGWEAARTYLAEQEPTDAEVREVWDALGPRVTIAMEYEDLRDALSAARAVRRDEEKR